MEAAEDTRDRPVHRIISYLIATGPVGSGDWRWRFTTVLAFIGPGSMPFGALLFATQNQALRDDYAMAPVAALLAGAATGTAVVLARFRPLLAWPLIISVLLATAFEGTFDAWEPWPATTPTLFALLVVQFALARDRRAWIAIGMWASYVMVAALAWWAYNNDPAPATPSGFDYPNPASDNLPLLMLLGALAFLMGLSVRIWRQGRAKVAEEEQVSAAERTRRRVLEERTRIARELHDIVAHHMSVIAVQSSTAEYRLADLSEDAREEFRSIGEQARGSLDEMRRMLAVLRSEDQAGLREPQPGPEGLEGLVEAVDRAGTPTRLTMVDVPEELPETVSLTVFRVVQEALSNVVRHAAGAATEVEVRGEDGRVRVTVVNAAPDAGGASPEPHGSGLGLVGMRERVVLEGGTLETGPTPEGGYEVRAVLPTAARVEPE